MAIETSPAHLSHAADNAASRLAPRGVAALACLFAAVVGLTLAHVHHAVSTAAIAASPVRIGEGRLWLLLTSGLLVQRPVGPSLLSFVALGCVTLFVCGSRALWVAAALGHVLSTITVYAGLSLLGVAEPGVFASTKAAPDYGVSAIAAAWLGAVARVAWTRHGSSPGGKALVAAGCIGVALFGWWTKGHLTALDSEHVVAFGLGVLAAGSGRSANGVRGRALSAAAQLR